MTSAIDQHVLSGVIELAEEALDTKVGLGSIRQIDRDDLSVLIAAARTVLVAAPGHDLVEHVAGLIADETGGDFGAPGAEERDAAERVISYFAERWHPMDQPPCVDEGRELRVIACWKSNDGLARVASGEIYYLNRVHLDWDEEGRKAEVCAADGTCSGWFERYEGADGGVTFEPISDQFVTHLAWTDMPIMPEASRG
ncbi:hypothetical protein [Sphingobium sp.]|uniref:hypothetical protein n=1 Tax=Sphingobium sp. TaxID=1912891 RepID=UPI000DB18345|nr:hypothetical protein [Sphingobium sp.]PZU71035.1 MAG: hypothetical protein DI540_00850 [Sphingobium sp.]